MSAYAKNRLTTAQAFSLYLEDVVRTDSCTVALAKALTPAFLLRGPQLTIIRRLASEHLVAVHTGLITWIVKQIQTSEASDNMKMKRKALAFFKAFVPLLTSADSRDALAMYEA